MRKYIYGPGIDEPLAMIDVDGQTETWYYYHFDGLGSVIALSDENGDLVESYSYNVFGKPTIYDGDGNEIAASAIGNPYMFTGRRYEQETGLYYYRLRDYHPVLGRFVQNDPIGCAGGLNLYRYCNNNPTNWTDPLGLASSWIDTPQRSSGPEWQEWLELMRLATFYSSTWGEWPDLTEYDYDWPGASSDSQGPTKGKVLTLSMLLKAMLEFYEKKLVDVEDENDFNWINADTIFHQGHYESMRFIYQGRVYTGGEINYIGIGMSLRHFQKNKYCIVGYPFWWNVRYNKHLPHEGDIYFTKLGFLYYPLIRNWHQRRRENNIR